MYWFVTQLYYSVIASVFRFLDCIIFIWLGGGIM